MSVTFDPEHVHEQHIRVRYCETDAMGFLHHANYLNYFEIGRTELFRSQGGNYRDLESRGFFLVIVTSECQYKAPARYDDLLAVQTRLVRTTPAKLIHEYRVFRDGTLLAIGRTVLACINQQGQVQRITRELLFGSAS